MNNNSYLSVKTHAASSFATGTLRSTDASPMRVHGNVMHNIMMHYHE